MVARKKLNGRKTKSWRDYPSLNKGTPPRRSLSANGAFIPTQIINQPGRSTLYKSEYAAQARSLYEHGYTEDEVAAFFNVSIVTLYHWRYLHPEFRDAQVIGKKPADERVIRSLFMRAVGFTVKEEKVFCNSDGDVTRAEVDKYFPPEVAAIVWWTKNRIGWRDKVEHSGDPERPIQHSYADELKQRLDKLSVPSSVSTPPNKAAVDDDDESEGATKH